MLIMLELDSTYGMFNENPARHHEANLCIIFLSIEVTLSFLLMSS